MCMHFKLLIFLQYNNHDSDSNILAALGEKEGTVQWFGWGLNIGSDKLLFNEIYPPTQERKEQLA